MLHSFMFEFPIDMCWLDLFSYHYMKDGIEYAEKNGMFYIETSAKTADNINQLFEVHTFTWVLNFLSLHFILNLIFLIIYYAQYPLIWCSCISIFLCTGFVSKFADDFTIQECDDLISCSIFEFYKPYLQI